MSSGSSGPTEAEMLEQVRNIFRQELQRQLEPARTALQLLATRPGDRAALQDLQAFFHTVAGSALSVGHPVLGHLASVCEHVSHRLLASVEPPNDADIQALKGGIVGAAAFLGESPGDIHLTPLPLPSSHEEVVDIALSSPSAVEGRKVLTIDDDVVSSTLATEILKGAGFNALSCSDPQWALGMVESELPDLILLDVMMPGINGYELCVRIRRHPTTQLTPIIFVTRTRQLEQRIRALEVGGNDVLTKPFASTELVARVRSHLERQAVLRELAIRDGLTRCFNHTHFRTRLEQEVARHQRYGGGLVVAMLDVDHFKKINDTYGHQAGDAVLASVAAVLRRSVRTTDVVARYGGEEFGILLVQSQLKSARMVCERLREQIANERFGEASSAFSVTVSIGIAELRSEDTPLTVVQRADKALYRAKSGGRNLVQVAT
jgi:two-component system cell cycle response regulator